MDLIYCLAKQVTGDIRHSNQSNVAESKMLKDWSHTSNAGEFSPAGSYFIYLIHSFRRTVQIVPLESGLECSLVSPAWKPENVKVKKWWLGPGPHDWTGAGLAWPKPLATQSPTLAGNFWGSTGTHKASEAQLSPWTVCCEWDDFKSQELSVPQPGRYWDECHGQTYSRAFWEMEILSGWNGFYSTKCLI